MARLRLLLAILVLAALAPSLHAQVAYPNGVQGGWEDVWIHNNYDESAPSLWVAERTPDPKFPVLVLLQQKQLKYSWGESTFFGKGVAHIFTPIAQNVAFKYDCGIAFPSNALVEFHARWVHHNTQLKILLTKPGTDQTRTCNIRPALIQQASTQPPATP